MAASFRFDQVTPGAGTPNRSRHDLVPNEIVSLVATSPAPGAGITFSWEILDKRGSNATLSATTGQTVSIGPGLSIGQPCTFLVELTVNDNGNITKCRRICSVRTLLKGLRMPVFPETAPTAQTLNLNDPDMSTDNAVYVDRSGNGVTEQNPFSWTEWAWELVLAVESGGGGGPPSGPAGGDLGGNYPLPTVLAIHETSGPTKLTIGAILDGHGLFREGTGLIGRLASGLKYHLRAGDVVTVRPDEQYMLKTGIIIDPGASFVISPGGQYIPLP